jgi:hypothetical protein
MTKNLPFWLIPAALCYLNCATKKLEPDGDRPRIFDKPGSNTGNLPHEKEQGQLYVRKKIVSISPVESTNTNGSLFNVDDERNYLFAARGPLIVGRFIDVDVNSNRLVEKPAEGKIPEKSVGDAAKAEKNNDDELMKSLPNLEPSSPDARPIHRFKMKIAHRFPNGDVLAIAERESVASQNQNNLSIQARIPYDRLISGSPISTDDLTEITMNESSDGEAIDRRSATWEDEYTLRMSGFNEANSKVAARLDQQRDQLRKIRDELKNRLIALGKERETMAGERNKLLEKNTASQTTIDGLNKSILDKETQIKTQEDVLAGKDKEIEALKPKT